MAKTAFELREAKRLAEAYQNIASELEVLLSAEEIPELEDTWDMTAGSNSDDALDRTDSLEAEGDYEGFASAEELQSLKGML